MQDMGSERTEKVHIRTGAPPLTGILNSLGHDGNVASAHETSVALNASVSATHDVRPSISHIAKVEIAFPHRMHQCRMASWSDLGKSNDRGPTAWPPRPNRGMRIQVVSPRSHALECVFDSSPASLAGVVVCIPGTPRLQKDCMRLQYLEAHLTVSAISHQIHEAQARPKPISWAMITL